LGIALRSSYSQTNTNYARTVSVDILSTNNCTVTLLDSMVKYANWTGTGSTNYEAIREFDATT